MSFLSSEFLSDPTAQHKEERVKGLRAEAINLDVVKEIKEPVY